MSEHVLDPLRRDDLNGGGGPDLQPGEVIEVPLLLPGWQVSALERAAHKRGLTAGEMVRHLLRDFFAGGQSSSCKVKVG